MILIADGGSTKADWIALGENKEELFRIRTLGLNPAVFPKETLVERLTKSTQLMKHKEDVKEVFFYGAGCGTVKPTKLLKNVFSSVFTNAKVVVEEDMLAAVYAASGGEEAIVCILGTGSNSCYYDGKELNRNVISLGYILMDEASGNHFGKRLIRDYYYHKMPEDMAQKFAEKFDVDPDVVKRNLYQEESPNSYLGHFASFMAGFKNTEYIRQILEEGFREFFECRILPYKKPSSVPIYFIGSIAYYYEDILRKVAKDYDLEIADILQRPIDNLIAYHQMH